MNQIEKLIADISIARNNYIHALSSFTEQQAQWKPSQDVWNVVEITEHLFWAEYGGILGMWKTLNAIRDGKMPRQIESVHQNMPIEEIITLTWQPKEQVPAVAAPRMGGPIAFWQVSFLSLQNLIDLFSKEMRDIDLRTQAHPHPISGAMDFQQRLEFIRFHIDRHTGQVQGIFEQL